MQDWMTLAGSGLAAVLALAGSAVSYGSLRQKVKDMNIRIDRLGEILERATDVRAQVDLLAAKTEGAQKLLLEKHEGGQTLINEKIDGLRAEVRSFMQGQTAVRRAPAGQA